MSRNELEEKVMTEFHGSLKGMHKFSEYLRGILNEAVILENTELANGFEITILPKPEWIAEVMNSYTRDLCEKQASQKPFYMNGGSTTTFTNLFGLENILYDIIEQGMSKTGLVFDHNGGTAVALSSSLDDLDQKMIIAESIARIGVGTYLSMIMTEEQVETLGTPLGLCTGYNDKPQAGVISSSYFRDIARYLLVPETFIRDNENSQFFPDTINEYSSVLKAPPEAIIRRFNRRTPYLMITFNSDGGLNKKRIKRTKISSFGLPRLTEGVAHLDEHRGKKAIELFKDGEYVLDYIVPKIEVKKRDNLTNGFDANGIIKYALRGKDSNYKIITREAELLCVFFRPIEERKSETVKYILVARPL